MRHCTGKGHIADAIGLASSSHAAGLVTSIHGINGLLEIASSGLDAATFGTMPDFPRHMPCRRHSRSILKVLPPGTSDDRIRGEGARVTRFTNSTYAVARQQLWHAFGRSTTFPRGIILDLCNNPGGLLAAAIRKLCGRRELASAFSDILPSHSNDRRPCWRNRVAGRDPVFSMPALRVKPYSDRSLASGILASRPK